ncbi:MAG TPA: bifunctional oligoribonuclease/PAP phosphatase NrnA [Flavobacteriaceae bacterium]|nr:bifunctional oligoribonuclease/PAP phosphatase NrnA [Flavobacteriaceae bacterium]
MKLFFKKPYICPFRNFMNQDEIQTLRDLLKEPKKIVIVPHRNPDGDALGSTLALYQFLKAENHYCTLISPNNYPEFLKWLPGEKQIILFETNREKAEKLIAEAEIIFTLDFNNLARTGEMEKSLEKAQADFVMIDHHQQPDNYARFRESEPEMSSTAEMVYNFIKKMGRLEAITPDIATCLYTGIMTDTGSFKYPSTTFNTHLVIAGLMKRGANNGEIHTAVYDTNSYDRLQLLGQALRNLKYEKKYNTAYITLTQAEKDANNFKKGDTEGFVNYALSMKGIILAAIFIEDIPLKPADNKEKIVKVSLRSKGDFDVNNLARKYFNGGGHRNAAGGKSYKNLEETISDFIGILPEYEDELNEKSKDENIQKTTV